MDNTYKKVKLGDVVTIRRGASPRPIQYYISKVQGIPWIKIADATAAEGKYIKKTKEFIKEDGVKHSVKVHQGDLILSNSATPGIPKFVNMEACIHDGWLLLTNFKDIDKEYLYYLLLSKQKELIHSARGTVFKNLQTDIVRDVEINLPPLPEQKRISSILSSFDNKIEQLKKQNNILEDIAQSIFKEWFVKYNFPNKDGKPYKDNNGKMIDSELGLIPEGWRVGKLGEITSITSGKNLPKKDLATKGKYEVLGANGKIGETNKYLFDKQLIFTGRVGTLGNVFLSNEPAWYSDNTLLIFPKNNFLYYVYRYLQRQRLEKLDRGSTQPLITQTDLKTILLPIPSLSLLNKFEKISTLINNKITQNKNNIDYFQKIKTALLNKLILA